MTLRRLPPPAHARFAYSHILDAIPPPESRGAAVTRGLLHNRAPLGRAVQEDGAGWDRQAEKRKGMTGTATRGCLMSTSLRESECSAFIRLTTLVPYFNVRCLIYSTNRLAGGRAWKVLESINLTFQWFFWWDSR